MSAGDHHAINVSSKVQDEFHVVLELGKGNVFCDFQCMVVLKPSVQGLEDAFDGNHRSDLQHVIVREHTEEIVGHPIAEVRYEDDNASELTENYFVCDPTRHVLDEVLPTKDSDSLLQLARLPTCAVFHRLTSGKGVPHSFAGRSS